MQQQMHNWDGLKFCTFNLGYASQHSHGEKTSPNEHHWCQTLGAVRFIVMILYYAGSYKDDRIILGYMCLKFSTLSTSKLACQKA